MDAFGLFARASGDMTTAYQALEARVAHLCQRLEYMNPGTEFSAQELTDLIQALPAGIVVLDHEGRIKHCNPAAEQLLGVGLSQKYWRAVIAQVFAPRPDDGHDVSLMNGRMVHIATVPLGYGPGQIIHITDVTLTRDLQNRVNRHERLSAMGEMAATLAHQIRTPLASTMLYLSQLKTGAGNVETQQRIVNKIILRIRHVENMVRDILIFAQGGYIGQDCFSTAELIRELVTVSEPHLAEQDMLFEIINPLPGTLLKGNMTMLGSALQNLLMNSIQAAGENGRLRLEVISEVDGSVDFILTDSGPGVPNGLEQQIFDPFYTTRKQGTGLGLAVVRIIARAHGGEVWCETGKTTGSRFILRLPVATHQEQADEAGSATTFPTGHCRESVAV
ncbi:MAG: hypothetical protein A2V90_09895 [Gammaproteobacteria bacterium RBG_16_57_12]|nr:MAG: hypothetical protein A2V90_09895 [Gammaproteobacteria bacterium RBG_16_57_12]